MSLQHINNMIKIEKQIELAEGNIENRGTYYSIITFLEKKCLNSFQSCIYKLPSSTAINKSYETNMDFLHSITQNIVNNVKKEIKNQNKKEGINIEYFPIYDGGPKDNDIGTYGYNKHYDFFT